ncbi:hypothetical protein [Deefgea sp. CFH1-16]|uniref:hypothetical protein n=1 Tax=Deefgea sp. CFH1-16 TaxID=2675457 RepID=UPI001940247D|nr:hypothetical protein [Deefgea sp. CFH1-16]
MTKKALTQFLNDQVNDRLKSAMSGVATPSYVDLPVIENPTDSIEEKIESLIVTTQEELEGFHIVKSILRTIIDSKRIIQRDTQSYFGVLLDDNNRKPLCRLHFNRNQKYIGIFDSEKNETRYSIESLDDIYTHSDKLISTVKIYENNV